MIPKLTDEAVSMLPLESGRAELLEEIMTHRRTRPSERRAHPAPGRHRRARWLVPLAVAAAVADRGQRAAVVGWRATSTESPDASFQAAPDSPGTGYRAVLTAPGWKADYVSEDDEVRR